MALALLVAATTAVTMQAQTPAGTDAPAQKGSEAAATAPIDVSQLGVSMSRIQKGMRISESRERSSNAPLKFEYQVQVYGASPRIDILQGFDVSRNAPLSYGAPTHTDFLNLWTPPAFRSPMVPFSALAGWAISQAAKRSEKSKCEEEIANYRQLVMQGVPRAAPSCTQ
jgi:hypothetical protein